MGKQLIELIGNFVEITGNSTVDAILVSISGFIAFSIAFSIVGRIFDVVGLYDSDIMSGVHWTIRIIVFCATIYALIKTFELITWLLSFQWWVYIIAILLIVLVIVTIYLIKYNIRKRINHKNNKLTEKVKDEINIVEPKKNETSVYKVYDKHMCPRCNQLLVKRHGPYGDFYGCSSYGTTGCTYTRKYL